MLKKIKADFHIHTCLSPCGDIQMTPNAIVEQARSVGLDAICICDHNSSENTRIANLAGKNIDLSVLYGMEVNSREEVHILAIFDDEKPIKEVQEIVYSNLIGENDEELFGYQMEIN
ncbi:MAG: PHP domain-containing protein, partial [Candidatus Delongbacteria bacterium]|nr:PHP domain-containing protein [Candidatus Delongbacteria bacterium]